VSQDDTPAAKGPTRVRWRPEVCRVIPGELHVLLERCRAEEAPAWDHFAAWVKTRGRAILSCVDKLSAADGDDAWPRR
jgi:hypothetical protein